jgi:hypothetical protein
MTVNGQTGEIVSPTYNRSADLAELFTALAKAQAVFESAEKAGKNPAFKSKYATLESVMQATREGREKNGLAIIQIPGNSGTNISVTTILGHASGQYIESTFAVAPVKFDAQGAGSVITYLRRYALMAVLGIAPEDDDGNAAVAQPALAPEDSGPRVTAFDPRRLTGETATASRARPAVAPPSPSRDVAVAVASRVRSDIKNATSLDRLNRSGIYGPDAASDEDMIRSQGAVGDKTWQSLVDLDAQRRLELAGFPETEAAK